MVISALQGLLVPRKRQPPLVLYCSPHWKSAGASTGLHERELTKPDQVQVKNRFDTLHLTLFYTAGNSKKII